MTLHSKNSSHTNTIIIIIIIIIIIVIIVIIVIIIIIIRRRRRIIIIIVIIIRLLRPLLQGEFGRLRYTDTTTGMCVSDKKTRLVGGGGAMR